MIYGGPGGSSGGRARSSRAAAVEAVDGLLEGMSRGPCAVLVEGVAGIGKTTIARAAAERARARGYSVAMSRTVQPDLPLSFSVLGDLLEAVPPSVLESLPDPQRDALEVALLRRPSDTGNPPDPRAVSLAALECLRAIAGDRPCLLVIEDLQWIDRSSAQVLDFVLQRLDGLLVGLLVTKRIGEDLPAGFDLGRSLSASLLSRVELGPMTAEELSALIRDRLGGELPRRVRADLHALVEGNPFYGLEVAREALRRGTLAPGTPLPLPQDALGVVLDSVTSLPRETQSALVVVACASAATSDLVQACLPELDVDDALAAAEAADLVVVEPRGVRFVHPLFGAAVVATTSAPELRRVHRRIAENVTDPEARARHLALASTRPDPAVADALDEASERARSRGAAATAAELALLACERTPPDDRSALTRRTVDAGILAFEAGDAPRALRLLEQAIDIAPPGPARAAVMVVATEITWQDTVGVETLARGALDEADGEPRAASAAHAALAWAHMYRGELDVAEAEALTARTLAGEIADIGGLADATTVSAVVACLQGRGHEALLEEAQRLTDEAGAIAAADGGTVYSSAGVMRGLTSMWSGDLAGAEQALQRELDTYEAMGRYVARDEILCYLAHLQCRLGSWDAASVAVSESLEIGEDSGHLRGRGQNIVPRAWLAALRGDLESARRDAAEGLEMSLRYRDELSVANNRGVLGFAALSEGDPATAVGHLAPVLDFLRASGIVHPGVVPFAADAIEALIQVGRLDEAQAAVDDPQVMGALAPRHLGMGAPQRAAALLAAARGDLDEAARRLEESLGAPDIAVQPFERARSLLALGDVHRRQKQRALARDRLEEAMTLFESLGAGRWLERAQASCARLSVAATGPEALSATEERVAALVAEGLSNKEVADRMFLSVKTVEANLSRIYRKLGIRSRSELVAALGDAARREG